MHWLWVGCGTQSLCWKGSACKITTGFVPLPSQLARCSLHVCLQRGAQPPELPWPRRPALREALPLELCRKHPDVLADLLPPRSSVAQSPEGGQRLSHAIHRAEGHKDVCRCPIIHELIGDRQCLELLLQGRVAVAQSPDQQADGLRGLRRLLHDALADFSDLREVDIRSRQQRSPHEARGSLRPGQPQRHASPNVNPVVAGPELQFRRLLAAWVRHGGPGPRRGVQALAAAPCGTPAARHAATGCSHQCSQNQPNARSDWVEVHPPYTP
mmetsp:Transcript_104796/g.306017  ORF Transcript_104796/g.306017 Transcript_104796/m.306017 type:complete len:270 (-) Transcript_104796:28-837(-)